MPTTATKLLLHTDQPTGELIDEYRAAFQRATELYVVAAYLTKWNSSLKLNSRCAHFRIIVGCDKGFTRIRACEDVLAWLPAKRKSEFMVADRINGFHPKAVFWAEANGKFFAIVGSSNLTTAAFESNFEANVALQIDAAQFSEAKKWVKQIERNSVPVSPDWLAKYEEADWSKLRGGGERKKGSDTPNETVEPIFVPRSQGMLNLIRRRRKQMAAHRALRPGLIRLIRQCAGGRISSAEFYERLRDHWSGDLGNRLQGSGFAIKGKSSKFNEVALSFLHVLEAADLDRDDIVRGEIDRLKKLKVASRGSFFSEMLCLEFPDLYPLLNAPVKAYLKDIEFTGARGASEGSRYIDVAIRLRRAVELNPKHPAKNLAELDTVLWLTYGREDE